MKRSVLLSLMVLICLYLHAQTKAKPTQNVTATKQLISAEENVKAAAEKWFKDVYVEKYFKDPYSYKLLKITSEKVNKKQSLLDSIVFLDKEIADCKLPEAERNIDTKNEYDAAYKKALLEIEKDEKSLSNSTDASNSQYYRKRIEINKKYGMIYLEKVKQYELLIASIREKERIEKKLATLTAEQEAKLSHYKIRIDCYSKNSIGNEVLGRFQFPFTEKGPVTSTDSNYNVVQTNKE